MGTVFYLNLMTDVGSTRSLELADGAADSGCKLWCHAALFGGEASIANRHLARADGHQLFSAAQTCMPNRARSFSSRWCSKTIGWSFPQKSAQTFRACCAQRFLYPLTQLAHQLLFRLSRRPPRAFSLPPRAHSSMPAYSEAKRVLPCSRQGKGSRYAQDD